MCEKYMRMNMHSPTYAQPIQTNFREQTSDARTLTYNRFFEYLLALDTPRPPRSSYQSYTFALLEDFVLLFIEICPCASVKI
jgi:hypothetical protein